MSETIKPTQTTQASDSQSLAFEQKGEVVTGADPAQVWLRENAEAIAASNAYVGQHGAPLEMYRMF